MKTCKSVHSYTAGEGSFPYMHCWNFWGMMTLSFLRRINFQTQYSGFESRTKVKAGTKELKLYRIHLCFPQPNQTLCLLRFHKLYDLKIQYELCKPFVMQIQFRVKYFNVGKLFVFKDIDFLLKQKVSVTFNTIVALILYMLSWYLYLWTHLVGFKCRYFS